MLDLPYASRAFPRARDEHVRPTVGRGRSLRARLLREHDARDELLETFVAEIGQVPRGDLDRHPENVASGAADASFPWQLAPALNEVRPLVRALLRQSHTIKQRKAASIASIDAHERARMSA